MQKIINNSLNSFQITKIHNKENFFLEKFNFFNKETSFLYGKFMFFQNIPRLFFEILIIVLLTILILVMIQLGYNFDEIFIKVAIFSASAFRIMPSINRLSYTYQGIVFSSSNTILSLFFLIHSAIFSPLLREYDVNFEFSSVSDSVYGLYLFFSLFIPFLSLSSSESINCFSLVFIEDNFSAASCELSRSLTIY